MSEEIGLKVCPHCQAIPLRYRVHRDYWISCPNCGTNGDMGASPDQAAAKWNANYPQDPSQKVELDTLYSALGKSLMLGNKDGLTHIAVPRKEMDDIRILMGRHPDQVRGTPPPPSREKSLKPFFGLFHGIRIFGK